jgi:hypothetical protein
MNNFFISDLVTEGHYNDANPELHTLVLESFEEPKTICYLPITVLLSGLIDKIRNDENDFINNSDELSIYRTMLNSWGGSGLTLGGVIFDLNIPETIEGEYDPSQFNLAVSLVINNVATSESETLVDISFAHSLILSAITDAKIMFNRNVVRFLVLKTNDMDDVEDEDGDSRKTVGMDQMKDVRALVNDIMSRSEPKKGAVKKRAPKKDKKNDKKEGNGEQPKE